MSSALWRAEGAALGPLNDTTVLLLTSDSSAALNAVTRGAVGTATSRRVAVFDLAGAFGMGGSDGLISAFRQGRSLNALARPLDSGNDECFVVAPGPGELDDSLATNPRWPQLVAGFRSAGALLVITAPLEFRGARQLAHFADRAFRLATRDGAPRLVPFTEPVVDSGPRASPRPVVAPASGSLATPAPASGSLPTPAPEPKSRISPGPLRVVRTAPQRGWSRGVRKAVRRSGALILVLGAGGGTWYWVNRHRQSAPAPFRDLVTVPPARGISRDTLVVPVIANPGDSVRAAQWGVELVATNDRADANLRLAAKGTLKAGTISPVFLSDDPAPWYKIIGGAFVDRTAAELLRQALRQTGAIEPDAGVVERVPLAFRLDTALALDAARKKAGSYVARGIAAYVLVGGDDRATIYTGAFSSPEQAVLLSAQLRAAGITPQLAFRVGRTF